MYDAPKIKMAFYLVKAKPRKELLESLHGAQNFPTLDDILLRTNEELS